MDDQVAPLSAALGNEASPSYSSEIGPKSNQRLLRPHPAEPTGSGSSAGTSRTEGVGGPVGAAIAGSGTSKSNRQ